MTEQSTNPSPSQQTFSPSDAQARQVITENLDDTLFVEASAGTGKTTSLVQRIVNLVVTGRTTMDRVAAITFTEAAATELRDRVRENLERAALDTERPDGERELCRQGAEDLDQANVRTLHAFAAQLLHERPLEAGLPPGFETSDEIVAGIAFEEAWNDWLNLVLEADSPIGDVLSLALSLGVTLTHLRNLAREFHANYADLNEGGFPIPEAEAGASIEALRERWPEAERLCQFSKNGRGDALFDHVRIRMNTVQALYEATLRSNAYYHQMGRLYPVRCGGGTTRNWETDPVVDKNACTALKAVLMELDGVVSEELEQAKGRALANILNALQSFVLGYAEARRREGRAEFQDLLVWARDLLRDNVEVRDHFRKRFSYLLIDESQDTDPIQAEIAMFLAEDVPTDVPECDRARSWDQVTPARGKLFVVGDPKQSIYRFRRADVDQMYRLQERMAVAGGGTEKLVQNFRSQKPVIDWVNHVFAQWMSDNGDETNRHQAPYDKMTHLWSAATEGGIGPRVWALGDEEMDENIDTVRRREATELGALLQQVVGEGWLMLDPEASGPDDGEKYRPVTFSDICILIPTRTSLPSLERGLEAFDVPYRLESASLIFESQEVRDLLNCMRAIDNPADRIATVAALRSPAFGCSDVDLLRHFEGGGQFDYLNNPDGQGEATVAEGLTVLKDFHQRRMWVSPAVLVEQFVRDRMLMESATDHPRMREQWRRYRFMVERAREYAEANGHSLRSFVSWIEDQISDKVRVTESPVPESDEAAVRVMTLHSAKGLEFPVVALTGINSNPNGTTRAAIFDRQRGAVEAQLGTDKLGFQTPGYTEFKNLEKEMTEAERVRLMYVATTRARDHLVLSLRRSSGTRNTNTVAHRISALMAGSPEMWEPVVVGGIGTYATNQPGRKHGNPPAAAFTTENSLEARDAWVAERVEMIASQGRPSFVSATGLGQSARVEKERKDEQEWGQGDEPLRRGRAGSQVGRAVHAVLQSIDLATGAGLEERAQAQATAEGIPNRVDDVIELSRRAVKSESVRRAVASQRLWREVPVATPVEGGFLHGFIDLLFEESDGLVVVDYKTDSVEEDRVEDAVGKYRLQGGAYACAVKKATGKRVKEVIFNYLAANKEVPLPDLEGAVRDAESRAREELVGAGALTPGPSP